ncbi:TetR/AcrR family transcriptional regulator [Cryptosporangium phraense]|uniref:TetR/AcrR family transcriptional regulator n=1 Tax=Cryptosporangium phraense TaxID=2593070 RepID=UPI0014796A9B|nr:TetR/AcrR family transcriptional regulator [Cryptosporangium phraense]
MSSTRERLLDVAEGVFCRLGYARTTIGELASAARVTRPTVYAYFPSKDDVFRALADRVRTEFLALQEGVDTSSPAATARAALTAFLDAYTRHYGVLTVIAHQALADPSMRTLRDEIVARVERRNTRFLERLVVAGVASPVIAPAALSRAVTGLVARSAERLADHPAEAGALADDLVAVYLRLAGIDAKPGF